MEKTEGSPPRVRGKRYIAAVVDRGFRITPACAGKTLRHGGFSASRQDHPRVCGENLS